MDISELIKGYEKFKDTKFKKYENKFLDLVENGQHPKVLFIACSDSRVNPSLITSANPGDLFIVRNIGNFIPPYNPEDKHFCTAAAIEYAVSELEVTDIIVCGHSKCGAIASMYKNIEGENLIHVRRWLKLGDETKEYIEKNLDHTISNEEKLRLSEKISTIFQLKNLLTYPEIKRKVDEGKLFLRAWYYDIAKGELEYFNTESGEYMPMESR